MTKPQTQQENSEILQSAAEPNICKDCKPKFFSWIADRTDKLSDLVMDYKYEWINMLNLDEEGFAKADFEEQQRIAKLMKEYDILQEFLMAEWSLVSIKEKITGEYYEEKQNHLQDSK